jgi:hypothetical protein
MLQVLRCGAFAFLGAALLATSALAQDEPDFSGTWVLDGTPSAPDTPRLMTVVQTRGPATTVRGTPMRPHYSNIQMFRTFAETPERTSHEGYAIGGRMGSVGGGSVPFDPNAETMSTYQNVLWEGQMLVIEYGHHTGRTAETGNWASHREIWHLSLMAVCT